MLLSLDLILGLLEFLSPFRYPISRISAYNHLFGRNYSIFGLGAECFDMQYVLSSPTGFHWNQNNYALVLLIFIPFLRRIDIPFIRNIGRMLILLLILATGSRIGFITASIIVIVSVMFEFKYLTSGIFPILLLALIYTDGFYFFPLRSLKVKEVALISKSEFNHRFPEHCYNHMNSENARKQLMFVGLDMFKENLIYGSGAGGFVMKMSQRNTNSSLAKRLTVNAHNYLLELLVDFGLLILIPAVWIIILFWRGIEKLDRDSTIEIIIFGITLLAGTVMVSSLVYFIPVYLIFYLVFIKVCSEHDSCASANI
jgi:hypothetical protein